jgi:ferredoxin-thioredoxin reductase catalytic subunit
MFTICHCSLFKSSQMHNVTEISEDHSLFYRFQFQESDE